MKDLPILKHPDLLVGRGTADDAAVFRISVDIALIQTVDFFTPILDDPYLFGQVAAANSLSDVYAMGGRPITALNIFGFPKNKLNVGMAAEILRGGQEKVIEAGATLVGGHTIDDSEPKYGLSVTGLIHPDRVLTNAAASPGDWLILTKQLGTGVIFDARMNDEISESEIRPAVESMRQLNKTASEMMVEYGAHACTDITGFGLLGHGWEMASGSGVGVRFRASDIPYLDLAFKLSEKRQGGGAQRNRAQFEPFVQIEKSVPESLRRLLFDPQTSGGLLIAVLPEPGKALLSNLKKKGLSAALVGEVVADHPGKIKVFN